MTLSPQVSRMTNQQRDRRRGAKNEKRVVKKNKERDREERISGAYKNKREDSKMHASPRRYIFRSHVFQRTNSRLSFQRKEGEGEREREVWSERKRGEGGERVWKRQWGWSSEIQKHLAASFDFTGLRQRKLDMYLRVCVLVHVQPHMHAPR